MVFTLLLVQTHAFIPSAGTGFGRPVAVGQEHVQLLITTIGVAGFRTGKILIVQYTFEPFNFLAFV